MKGNVNIINLTGLTISQAESTLKTKTAKGWRIVCLGTIDSKPVAILERADVL